MTRILLALLITVFQSAALGGETISVYQLDGSIQCRDSGVITPARSAEILEQAGVKVISSSSRSLPVGVSGNCGIPTGRANVLVVDAGDWRRFAGKKPGASGFGIWVFDRPEIEVYKYDGSLQCERGREIPLEEMARELTDYGIEVHASRKGTDGRMHIAMCGASTGRLNVYTISTQSLDRARKLGFELLVSRMLTNEISTSSAKRRAPALSRTAPRAPQTETARPVPELW